MHKYNWRRRGKGKEKERKKSWRRGLKHPSEERTCCLRVGLIRTGGNRTFQKKRLYKSTGYFNIPH